MALEPNPDQVHSFIRLVTLGDTSAAFTFARDLVLDEVMAQVDAVRAQAPGAHDEECFFVAADLCLARVKAMRGPL